MKKEYNDLNVKAKKEYYQLHLLSSIEWALTVFYLILISFVLGLSDAILDATWGRILGLGFFAVSAFFKIRDTRRIKRMFGL